MARKHDAWLVGTFRWVQPGLLALGILGSVPAPTVGATIASVALRPVSIDAGPSLSRVFDGLWLPKSFPGIRAGRNPCPRDFNRHFLPFGTTPEESSPSR